MKELIAATNRANAQQKLSLLPQALKYGNSGIDFLIEHLKDQELMVREKAYQLLRKVGSEKAKQAISPGVLLNPGDKTSLADWSEENIFLALDTSLFWDKYCLVSLCVIHRGRALPLIWRVIEHESASVSFADYQEIIEQAQSRLPESVTVVLLADRGFVHTKLMTMLTAQYRMALSYPNQKQYLDLERKLVSAKKLSSGVVEKPFVYTTCSFTKESFIAQFM